MIHRAGGILIDAAGAALRADAGVVQAFVGKAVRVLEVVPETGPSRQPHYPYAAFAALEKKRLPDDCGAARARITLYLHVWDTDDNIRRVMNIAEACELPMTRLVLAPETGLRLAAREHQVTRCNFDADRQLNYGLCQVEYVVSALSG